MGWTPSPETGGSQNCSLATLPCSLSTQGHPSISSPAEWVGLDGRISKVNYISSLVLETKHLIFLII